MNDVLVAEKMNLAGKRTALITGGSSGIGLEFARLFARDGYRLLLVANPLKELEDAKNNLLDTYPESEVLIKAQDLAQHGAAESLYDFTKENDIQIDVLVNCAGFGTYGFVDTIDVDRELSMLQLHVGTLYHINRLYVRDMMDRDCGQIINMSSISAFQPNPYFATYGASKSFVLNFSRALNFELCEKGSKVRVMAVCPTAVKGTGFQDAAGMGKTKTFDSWMCVTPDVVARDAYRAMERGKDLVVPGRFLGIGRSLVCRLPTNWLMRISRYQLRE
ncbi:SDR family oxidoreductase [Methanolobus sp. ZRKC3]|uniref:SDR family NAD(P)-dependent oxidoreductase n=1 Tax=Methanolobus sp. ZRKC3 TaxID=3125786 RepID=UPI003252340D